MESFNFVCAWAKSPTLELGPQSAIIEKISSCILSLVPQASSIIRGGNLELGWLLAQGLHRAATVSPIPSDEWFKKNGDSMTSVKNRENGFNVMKLFWRIELLQPLYSAIFISIVSCFCQGSYVRRLSNLMERWVETAGKIMDTQQSKFSSLWTEKDELELESAFIKVICGLEYQSCSGKDHMLSPKNLVWSLWMSWWGTWFPDVSRINKVLGPKEKTELFNCEQSGKLSLLLLFSSPNWIKDDIIYERTDTSLFTVYDFTWAIGKVVTRCVCRYYETELLINPKPTINELLTDEKSMRERVCSALWRGLLQPVDRCISFLHGLNTCGMGSLEKNLNHFSTETKYYFFSSVNLLVYLIGHMSQLVCGGIPLIQRTPPPILLLKKWIAIRSQILQIIYLVLREELKCQSSDDAVEMNSLDCFRTVLLNDFKSTFTDFPTYDKLYHFFGDVKKKLFRNDNSGFTTTLNANAWIQLIVKVGYIDDMFCEYSTKLAQENTKNNINDHAAFQENGNHEYNLWSPGMGNESASLTCLLSICLEWGINQIECPQLQSPSLLKSLIMSPVVRRIIKWMSFTNSVQSSRWRRWNQLLQTGDTQMVKLTHTHLPLSRRAFIGPREIDSIPLDYCDFRTRLFSSQCESVDLSEKTTPNGPIYALESLLEDIFFSPVVGQHSDKNSFEDSIPVLHRRALVDVLFAVCGIVNRNAGTEDQDFYASAQKSFKLILSRDPIAVKGLWFNLHALIIILIRKQQYVQSWRYLCFLTHHALSSSPSRMHLQLWAHALHFLSSQINKEVHVGLHEDDDVNRTFLNTTQDTNSLWKALQFALLPFSEPPNPQPPTPKLNLLTYSRSFDNGLCMFRDAVPRRVRSIENVYHDRAVDEMFTFITLELSVSPCQQYFSLTRKVSHTGGTVAEFSLDVLIGRDLLMEISALRRLLLENKRQICRGSIKSESSSDQTVEKVRWWASRISLEEEFHDLVDRFDEIIRSGCPSKCISSNFCNKKDEESPPMSGILPLLFLGQVDKIVSSGLEAVSEGISKKWIDLVESNMFFPKGYTSLFIEIQELTTLVLQGLPYLSGPFSNSNCEVSHDTISEEEKKKYQTESRSISRKGISLRKRFSLPPCVYVLEKLGCDKKGAANARSGNSENNTNLNANIIQHLTSKFLAAFYAGLGGLRYSSTTVPVQCTAEEKKFNDCAREFLQETTRNILNTCPHTPCVEGTHNDVLYSLYNFFFECVGQALRVIARNSPYVSRRDALNVEARDMIRLPRQHVYLVLEPPLNEIPWEVFHSLRLHSVSRVPSVDYIKYRLQYLWRKRSLLSNRRDNDSTFSCNPDQHLFQRSFIVFDRNATDIIPDLEKLLSREKTPCSSDVESGGNSRELNDSVEDIIQDTESIQEFLDKKPAISRKRLWSYLKVSSLNISSQDEEKDNIPPTREKPFSLYLYLGHKAGGTLVSRSELLDSFPSFFLSRESPELPSVFLMGCSSARFDLPSLAKASSSIYRSLPSLPSEVTTLEGGFAHAYLHAGVPTFVGCLWDVTNGEIDGILLNLIKSARKSVQSSEYNTGLKSDEELKVGLNIKRKATLTLGEAIALARQKCKLPMLTGGSVIFYGINNILLR